MAKGGGTAVLSGQLKQWHKVTLEFEGPRLGETASTFLDHRLDVTFRHEATGKTVTVPGHFAADGEAAHTGAAEGSTWRAHFNPTEAGAWSWTASFRVGDKVAVAADAKAGASGGFMDGATGRLAVGATDKGGADLRGKGLLEHDGDAYLNHAGTGEVFLKSGVGSPENLLAYAEFDNTPASHAFAPHARHFEAGDPTWDGGRGKALIGAVNYLADQGVNSAYMLLMTVGGDGQDVWPWAASDLDKIAKNAGNSKGSFDLTHQARAFDVSKLDQWEIVFEHMQKKGINLHLFLQETENDHLLNDGDMGLERALYMREMVARFGHHNGVIWNLGEETTNSAAQIKAQGAALKALDPYGHPVALHTYPTQHARYEALEGSGAIDVLSFQTNGKALPDLGRYMGGAEGAGHAVAAFLDESGGASVGLAAEGDKNWQQNHAEMRDLLWRSYMDGASGAEWYFGYATGGGKAGDLMVESFATRHSAYAWAKAAREFFEDLPLERMKGADGLTASATDQVLAAKGEAYAIYLPGGGTTTIDLSGETGRFAVTWHDPLTGAAREGTVASVQGGGKVAIGLPPVETGRAWAAVLRPAEGGAPAPAPAPVPAPTPTPKPAPGDTIDLIDADGGSASALHRMQGGLVVMQAEDGALAKPGASGNANWALKKGLAGYKGDGYLLWDTNKDYFNTRDAGKDHTGPMTYSFRVEGDAKDVAGTYFISLRAMKPKTGEGSDRNNDFYVAVGEAGEDPGAWKKVFFSGGPNQWLWGHTYDVNHKKSPATFTVDEPGDYTIWISGRSRQAGLDEIHVKKGARSADHKAASSPFVEEAREPAKPAPVEPAPQPQPDPAPAPAPAGKADAVADVVKLTAADVAIANGVGVATFEAARLLANDSGHDGRVAILSAPADGTLALSDGGRTLTYRFDAKGFDGKDAFTYRVFGAEGSRDHARAYLEVDLSKGTAQPEPAPAPTPPPAPQPKPEPAPGPLTAANDGFTFGADEATLSGGRAAVAVPVAELLANDTGHTGRIALLGNAMGGDAALSADGASVAFRFDGADAPAKGAFSYRVFDGEGGSALGRAYLGLAETPAPSKPAPTEPKPAEPAPEPGPEAPAAVVARPDAFVFEWGRDVFVDEDTGTARISLSASDLLANDAGGEALQATPVRAPADAGLRVGGMETDYNLHFDPARFDGRTSFDYLAYDGLDRSAPATVSIEVRGLPAPAPATATLRLVDAGADRALTALAARTVIEADSVAGRSLSVVAEAEVAGVRSARLFLDGKALRVEGTEPYALFGDVDGDFAGGLALGARGVAVGVELRGGAGGSGAVLGEAEARLWVEEGVLRGTQAEPDVFAFDEGRMGADRIAGFEGFDRLSFFGERGLEAREVLALARVSEGDTVIDLGGGNVLTLDGFTQLGLEHIL